MNTNSNTSEKEKKQVTNKQILLVLIFFTIGFYFVFNYNELFIQVAPFLVFITTLIFFLVKIFHWDKWKEIKKHSEISIENYEPSRQFRILAGIFSIYFWCFTIIAISGTLSLEVDLDSKFIKYVIFDIFLFIVSYTFSYIAIKGRIPRIAKKILKIF